MDASNNTEHLLTNRRRAELLMEQIAQITGTYRSQKSITLIERALDEAERRGETTALTARVEAGGSNNVRDAQKGGDVYE